MAPRATSPLAAALWAVAVAALLLPAARGSVDPQMQNIIANAGFEDQDIPSGNFVNKARQRTSFHAVELFGLLSAPDQALSGGGGSWMA